MTISRYTFKSFLGSLKLNEKDTIEHTFISLSCSLNHEGDAQNRKIVFFFSIDQYSWVAGLVVYPLNMALVYVIVL